VAARIGIFAGAGIALLSMTSSSASASTMQTRSVVRTHAVAVDADDAVVGGRVVEAAESWSTRHWADPPASTVRRVAAPVVTAGSLGGVWACIRNHESGGNYAINTGNGYYGAYQFSLSTWYSVGGTGLPSQASPAEQDMRAQILQARSGWGPWPTTSVMCGV
jgi:hypothetical protein